MPHLHSLLSAANGKDPEESLQNPQAKSGGKSCVHRGRLSHVGPNWAPRLGARQRNYWSGSGERVYPTSLKGEARVQAAIRPGRVALREGGSLEETG